MWIVEHAAQRQDYICQAQSVNLFFTIPTATEKQEVHDVLYFQNNLFESIRFDEFLCRYSVKYNPLEISEDYYIPVLKQVEDDEDK